MVSPDGESLVFHGTRDGDADIYTMKATVEGPNNPAVNLTNDLPTIPGAHAELLHPTATSLALPGGSSTWIPAPVRLH